MKKISILIADDHAIVRMGLSALFRYERDMTVIGEAEDGESAVRLADKLGRGRDAVRHNLKRSERLRCGGDVRQDGRAAHGDEGGRVGDRHLHGG